MEPSYILGEQIKKIRLKLDLEQKDFAGKLGVSNVHLSTIEKGKKLPSEDLINKIFAYAKQPVTSEILDLLYSSQKSKKQKGTISSEVSYSLQNSGNYNKKSLLESLKSEPENIKLILAYLTLLKEEGKTEEARQFLLQSLIKISREEVKKWLEASYFMLEGNFDTAILIMSQNIEAFSKSSPEKNPQLAGLMFELANIHYEYGYKLYNSNRDKNSAQEHFMLALSWQKKLRDIHCQPYYEMLYANTFWWLAFLGVEEESNWKSYIDKAQNVLLLNHEHKMINTQPGKVADGLYANEYILQIISGLAEAYAKLAFREYSQENYDPETIKSYLKQGEFLLIQHAPINIFPQRREYYNFYFSYACFYSMKAELLNDLNLGCDKYLDLCFKGLQEASYSESKINSKQFENDLTDALKKELKFFQQKRNDELEYIRGLGHEKN